MSKNMPDLIALHSHLVKRGRTRNMSRSKENYKNSQMQAKIKQIVTPSESISFRFSNRIIPKSRHRNHGLNRQEQLIKEKLGRLVAVFPQ